MANSQSLAKNPTMTSPESRSNRSCSWPDIRMISCQSCSVAETSSHFTKHRVSDVIFHVCHTSLHLVCCKKATEITLDPICPVTFDHAFTKPWSSNNRASQSVNVTILPSSGQKEETQPHFFLFCKRFPYCNLHLVIHLVTSLFLEHFNDNTSYHIRQRNIPKLFGFYRNCEIKDKERGKMRLVLKANMTVKYVYY